MVDNNDYGPAPYIFNIQKITMKNDAFRVTKWSGENLQLTLMSIEPGGGLGMEAHDGHDQLIRVESGTGIASIGNSPEDIIITEPVSEGSAVLVPNGAFRDVQNTGDTPLKLYSIYAPAEHPHGTFHKTRTDAEVPDIEELMMATTDKEQKRALKAAEKEARKTAKKAAKKAAKKERKAAEKAERKAVKKAERKAVRQVRKDAAQAG